MAFLKGYRKLRSGCDPKKDLEKKGE